MDPSVNAPASPNPAPPPPVAALGKSPTPTPRPPESSCYFNRDLSWLDFNTRVLHEAEDPRTPLLDRVKFLAIFSSNQDEFFMKRIGLIKRRIDQRWTDKSLDGQSPEQQLAALRERIGQMSQRQVTLWHQQIRPELNRHQIYIRSYAELNAAHQAKANEYFQQQIFPVLTPLAVDPGHPFPFISNLSVSVGVLLRQPGQREHLFARVKVPQLFSRWLTFVEGEQIIYMPLESLVQGRLELLFPGMEILERQPFRVTRNAEVDAEVEDLEDLLEVVQEELRARRFADTVRVQIPPAMSDEMRQYLIDGLEIFPEDIYEVPEPLGLVDMMAIANAEGERFDKLRIPEWKPDADPALADPEADIFGIIRQGDVLVHHPYESFDTSVERFILSAVNDPRVLAIKMTLYRTSGDSPFVPALARAAEAGKQVAVLVELQARFDEERNIQWAHALENAGAHVVYGVLGLKTHTKTALVVRREDDRPGAPVGTPGGLRCYAHIATGNYNSKTAELYTDLGLLTCRQEICDDLIDLFGFLTGRSLKTNYRKLLVAPVTMRQRFLEMIDREIAPAQKTQTNGTVGANGGGRIIAKMNALEDAQIIQALYKASQAGVQIDLIIRGFCCLRPGVTGLSENIRVISVIGRFLEHSRIFYFQNGGGGHEEFYLGSADWMTRNLSHRVEAAVPIEDSVLRESLWEILEIMLQDNRQAWDLHPDGIWTQRQPAPNEPERGTHQRMMDLTVARAKAARTARTAAATLEEADG